MALEGKPEHICKETHEFLCSAQNWYSTRIDGLEWVWAVGRFFDSGYFGELHYCSDECHEPYLARMIEKKLKGTAPVRTGWQDWTIEQSTGVKGSKK